MRRHYLVVILSFLSIFDCVESFYVDEIDNVSDSKACDVIKSTDFYKSCVETPQLLNENHKFVKEVILRISDRTYPIESIYKDWLERGWMFPFHTFVSKLPEKNYSRGSHSRLIKRTIMQQEGEDMYTCARRVDKILKHWGFILDRIQFFGRKIEPERICSFILTTSILWDVNMPGYNQKGIESQLEWRMHFKEIHETNSFVANSNLSEEYPSIFIQKGDERSFRDVNEYITNKLNEEDCRHFLYFSMIWSLFEQRKHKVSHNPFWSDGFYHFESGSHRYNFGYNKGDVELTCLEYGRMMLGNELNSKVCDKKKPNDAAALITEKFLNIAKLYANHDTLHKMNKLESIGILTGCDYYEGYESVDKKKNKNYWTVVMDKHFLPKNNTPLGREGVQWLYSIHYDPLYNGVYMSESFIMHLVNLNDKSLSDDVFFRTFVEVIFVLGHELYHSCDEKGIMFDNEGYLSNDPDHYVQKTKDYHILSAYDKGILNNPVNTYIENMADIHGIITCYKAYMSVCMNIPDRDRKFCSMGQFSNIYKSLWNPNSIQYDGVHSSETLRMNVPLEFLKSSFRPKRHFPF